MSSISSSTTETRITDHSGRMGDYWELTKPRLSLMSVASAVLGYFAAGPQTDWLLFSSLVVGTTLAAFGAAVLNQWWERDADAKMNRTAGRPLVEGRVSPDEALWFGIILATAGTLLVWWGIHWVAAALTAATVLLYLLAYTPLKMVTPWSTEIGAIPGALPPLIGWVAAGAGFSAMGWVLFAVLFAWQMPHFMAISWFCREDYRRAGFALLSVRDSKGDRVALRGLFWAVVLVAVSILPAWYQEVTAFFWIVTSALSLMILLPAWSFWRNANRDHYARRLFAATLIYLPVYLATLVGDRFFL